MADIDAKKIEELRGLYARFHATDPDEWRDTMRGKIAREILKDKAFPALLDLASKALATLSLAGEDAGPVLADNICREVTELQDSTWPDDAPDMMLVSAAELRAIVLEPLRSLSLRVEAEKRERERLKDRIDLRMNDYLVEMREGYDDSITGFNEAWDIVRSVFADMESNNAGK